MSTEFEIFERYTCRPHQQIQAITEPLNEHFGIDFFGYQHVNNEGGTWGLTNNLAHSASITMSKSPAKAPHIVHPTHMLNTVLDLNAMQHKSFYQDWQKEFHQTIGMSRIRHFFVKSCDHFYDIYSFATSYDNNYQFDLFISNRQLLEQFIQYFMNETKKLRSHGNNHCFEIRTVDGHCYDALPEEDFLNDIRTRGLNFLHDINQTPPAQQDYHLTKRQLDCIKGYLHGMTAQETADELKISRKTVEYHFERIKETLNIKFKSQIEQKMKELGYLDLLV